jgi:hypothetical protein
VQITRSDSASADPDGRLGPRDAWYRVVSGRDTTYKYPIEPDGVPGSDGRPLRVLVDAGSEHWAGRLVSIYAPCQGEEHALLLEPEYATELQLGDVRAGADGAPLRDIVWVERAGSNDPDRDYTSAHVLRFDGRQYRLDESSWRVLPTGSGECPFPGERVYILGTSQELPDSAPVVPVQVVPVHPVPARRAVDFPRPRAAEQRWRGSLNGDAHDDRIVAFLRSPGEWETFVYAGCGGYAYVQVAARVRGAPVVPVRHPDAGGRRWRDLVVDGGRARDTLRFDGKEYTTGYVPR